MSIGYYDGLLDISVWVLCNENEVVLKLDEILGELTVSNIKLTDILGTAVSLFSGRLPCSTKLLN